MDIQDKASQSPEDELSQEELKVEQRNVVKQLFKDFQNNDLLYFRKMNKHFFHFHWILQLDLRNNIHPDKLEKQIDSYFSLLFTENQHIVERMRRILIEINNQVKSDADFDEFPNSIWSICLLYDELDMFMENLRAFVLTFGGPEDWDFMQAVNSEDVENMDMESSSASSLPSLMDSDDSTARDWENIEEFLFYSERED